MYKGENTTFKTIKFYENRFIKLPEKDFWDDLLDEDKKAIDRGLADIVANRVRSYEDVMEKYTSRKTNIEFRKLK